MDRTSWLGGAGAVCVHALGSYSSEHVSLMHLPPYERIVRYAGRGHVCGVSTLSFLVTILDVKL